VCEGREGGAGRGLWGGGEGGEEGERGFGGMGGGGEGGGVAGHVASWWGGGMLVSGWGSSPRWVLGG
jgi:hypothetical protein